jgi:hypothetical protein
MRWFGCLVEQTSKHALGVIVAGFVRELEIVAVVLDLLTG